MVEEIVSVKDSRILIRPLEGVHEMNIGVDLQRRIWGFDEIDIVPDQIFIVAERSGGQVLGAFHEGKAIGIALAFAGMHRGTVYLHSHLVGVAPEYQNRGIGRLLKLAQRDDAIARGIDLIEWTFDPLQLKNAYFNLARLGAVVRRYIPNCYGRTSSPLHAGLPTDRLVAEWPIKSARVLDLLTGKTGVPKANCPRISIPTAIRQTCGSDPLEAEKIQSRVREQFQRHFAAGCAALGFELDEQQGSYILEPYEN
jgi:predicted GNAT superfamily acetyltransferase